MSVLDEAEDDVEMPPNSVRDVWVSVSPERKVTSALEAPITNLR